MSQPITYPVEVPVSEAELARVMSAIGKRKRTMTAAAREQRKAAVKARWEKHRKASTKSVVDGNK